MPSIALHARGRSCGGAGPAARLSLALPLALALLLAACAAPATPNTPTATAKSKIAQAVVTATVAPSITPTPTLTATPAPTTRATSTRTATPTGKPTTRPTARPTNTALPQPTPLPGPVQTCANLIAAGRSDMSILYVNASPDLVWDTNPHYFVVGICDSIPAPATPMGRYRAAIYFPGSAHGRAESMPVPATINPGFNEVRVGPWVPGLENHRAACNDRPLGDVEIEYDGSGVYRALPWVDGKTRVLIPIACGGDYA